MDIARKQDDQSESEFTNSTHKRDFNTVLLEYGGSTIACSVSIHIFVVSHQVYAVVPVCMLPLR